MAWCVRRIFFSDAHEIVAKKWIDKELSNVSVRVKLTAGALKFIKAKCERESSLLIVLSHRIIASRRTPFALPCAEARLGVADPGEDFVKVASNAGIPVLVAREIYEVLKRQKNPFIVTTSGLWKYKKLYVKQDLSWSLYSREGMRRRIKRWSTYE